MAPSIPAPAFDQRRHDHRILARNTSAASGGSTNLAAISVVIVVIFAAIGVWFYRHRKAKKREAFRSRKSRAMVDQAFPRNSRRGRDPELPPYEPAAPQQQQVGQGGGDVGSAIGDGQGMSNLPRVPPPARGHTPPGYGLHLADREAGPLSDAPPAYEEDGRQRWGRSGCTR